MEDKPKLDGVLQDLLAQQLVAVQRVVAYNQEITKRLGDAGLDLSTICTVSRAPPCPPSTKTVPEQVARDGKVIPKLQIPQPDLTEPLLPKPLRQLSETSKAASVVSKWKKFTKKDRAEKAEAESSPRSPTLTRASVFPNPDEMKRRVMTKINKKVYNVEDYYKTEGVWQKWARNETFQNSALVVILMNTLWIAIDTDYNHATILSDAPPLFQIMNNLFCFAFVFELTVRFLAFEHKPNCLRDGWFVFDGILVGLMVWETWIEVALNALFGVSGGGAKAASILRIFRMLRLTRVARLARIMRQMPELMILIKGMAIATKSVMATLVLLVIIIYVFAVLFTQQLAGTDGGAGCFDNVPQAMNCLLLNGVFSEEREFISKMLETHWIFYVVSIVYLLLSSLTVLNMLIGVLCEVISVTAKVEQEELLMQDLKVTISKLVPHFNEHDDSSGNQLISKAQFHDMFDSAKAMEALQDVGIDVYALVDFADFIFREKDELQIGVFLEKILQFRGENKATVKDVVDMRMFFQHELAKLEDQLMNHHQPMLQN